MPALWMIDTLFVALASAVEGRRGIAIDMLSGAMDAGLERVFDLRDEAFRDDWRPLQRHRPEHRIVVVPVHSPIAPALAIDVHFGCLAVETAKAHSRGQTGSIPSPHPVRCSRAISCPM